MCSAAADAYHRPQTTRSARALVTAEFPKASNGSRAPSPVLRIKHPIWPQTSPDTVFASGNRIARLNANLPPRPTSPADWTHPSGHTVTGTRCFPGVRLPAHTGRKPCTSQSLRYRKKENSLISNRPVQRRGACAQPRPCPRRPVGYGFDRVGGGEGRGPCWPLTGRRGGRGDASFLQVLGTARRSAGVSPGAVTWDSGRGGGTGRAFHPRPREMKHVTSLSCQRSGPCDHV